MLTELQKLGNRAKFLKKKLAPWKGLTVVEALKQGWSQREADYQAELWENGHKVIAWLNS